jgi:hypothetical protein
MTTKKKMLQTSAGPLYIEDAFSTDLYTGNGGTQTITNGIDLSGEGGLTWIKSRSAATDHQLFDTKRGVTKELVSNSRAAEATDADTLTAFNYDGFSIGADSNVNTNAATFVAWTFRKAPKFFDVVTYTGTGVNRSIEHDLEVAPGVIIVKSRSTEDWVVFHRSLTSTTRMKLNGFQAAIVSGSTWITEPTDSAFTVGTSGDVNANGQAFLAYLFAHEITDDSFIQCGSYIGNGSASGPVVTLGWEPQWVLIKNAEITREWHVVDSTRGATKQLEPNTSDVEVALGAGPIALQSTGFQLATSDEQYNTYSQEYIYMAIRAEE